jgi:hypothetical protein
MRLRLPVAAMLLALLAGCSTKVVRVDMDVARLSPPGAQVDHMPLLCDYQLGDVVDDRADGPNAGGLSENAFKFADAADVVRKQLLRAGLVEGHGVHGPSVDVHIVQLYLTQNLETKVPVAVYRVTIGDEPALVLRSQKASLNWNGTQGEAYAAYGRVMADVNLQLVAQLNRRCPRT